ncbi:hypothetical protein LPJ75_005811, partial [Coemansia sp. RSA 2598]
MAQGDSLSQGQQQQQPSTMARSRRGRYFSITPWAIALLLVVQKAEALQQMSTQIARPATTHGSIVSALANNRFHPATLSTHVQGLGRLAGGDNDKGYATDSDNEGSGSDSEDDEHLYKKGGKDKSHKKHDGHGHGYGQGPSNPYQPGSNPYQPAPGPYQPGPNPYKSAPGPYQPAPNPYQPAPGPYPPGPNPYPSSPGHYNPAGSYPTAP